MANITKKREEEKELVGFMIQIYCYGNHNTKKKCLCEECNTLLEYTNQRINKCPMMETKTFCSTCKVHCYQKQKAAQIRQVMRYAGPRMLRYHPILAIKHLYDTKIKKA